MLWFFVEVILMMMLVIVGIGFLTLMERNIMGYSQNRKSPNKSVIIGIMQSVIDGIKLLNKDVSYLDNINYLMFIISPLFMFMLMFMSWSIVMMIFEESSKIGILFIMIINSLTIFGKLLIGYSSSKMSSIGSIRSIMQTISYEIVMSIMFYIMLIMMTSYSLNNVHLMTYFSNVLFVVMWLMVLMCECIRIPFDLVESESELISGYNIEYSSIGVVMIFMSEYGSTYLLSLMTSIVLGLSFMSFVVVVVMLLWLKSVFARVKYDLLMGLLWLYLIPISSVLLLIMLLC